MPIETGQIVKNLISSEPVTVNQIQALGSMVSIKFTGVNTNRANTKVISTISGYDTWFFIGCCFAGTFGEEGRNYFHKVSQFYKAYTYAEANKVFDSCLKWEKRVPGMYTFYSACKEFGILYKEFAP